MTITIVQPLDLFFDLGKVGFGELVNRVEVLNGMAGGFKTNPQFGQEGAESLIW